MSFLWVGANIRESYWRRGYWRLLALLSTREDAILRNKWNSTSYRGIIVTHWA